MASSPLTSPLSCATMTSWTETPSRPCAGAVVFHRFPSFTTNQCRDIELCACNLLKRSETTDDMKIKAIRARRRWVSLGQLLLTFSFFNSLSFSPVLSLSVSLSLTFLTPPAPGGVLRYMLPPPCLPFVSLRQTSILSLPYIPHCPLLSHTMFLYFFLVLSFLWEAI